MAPYDPARPVVILVDEHDHPTGEADKAAAHEPPGMRHRALSAFVLDAEDRIILQRRASAKYHFAGLWSNSCCTHPAPGEAVVVAGERRVAEELGIECRLRDVGVFAYRAVDPVTGLVEDEVDHVLVGRTTAAPAPDPAEVDEVMALGADELQAEIRRAPDRFTPWLADALAVLREAVPLVPEGAPEPRVPSGGSQ